MRNLSQPRRLLAAGSAALLGAATLSAIALSVASPAVAAGIPALSPLNVPGRGASVPFLEQEAEYAATNGTFIGPNRYYGTLPSEASGRQAVTLDAVGEYVEFTLTAPANAMVLRASIPDGPSGQGRDATIDVRVNNTFLKTMPVTSKYGWYYGGYPFNNNPGDTNPHHFYDETRTMFGQTYAAGTKIRVQVASTAASPSFTIDLADFENVPAAKGKPANAIDVVADFGADPTGAAVDNTAKFQAAVDAGKAQGRTVYVPQGTYTVWDHIVVDGVTLAGAGPWYSVLTGRHPTQRNRAVGIYGKYVPGGGYGGAVRSHEANGPSRNVTVKDLAIIGDIQERVDDDQVNAMGGAMTDSVIDNVWFENTKVAAWMDGPMNNFVIKNSRILDQTADGVNFHTGVTNSAVTNTFVRNTGDDGLAMWPERVANVNNSFDHNTVGVTILANNIVSYGGRDIKITDNVTADSITNGGGIHIANRYPGVSSGQGTAVAGTFTVARNTLIRNGNSDYNWNFGVGAIWFSGLNEPIAGATINITDTDILDSSYAALHWIEGQSSGINLNNVKIDGAGTYALQVQAASQVSFTNVVATHIAQPNPIHNCVGSGFQITQGAGNSGWYANPPACTGVWPTPVWTNGGIPSSPGPSTSPSPSPSTSPQPVGQLNLSTSSLTFGTQNIGSTSAAQTVTVSNPGSIAVNISGVAVSGDFARTTTCGATLAPGATCTVSATFTPTVSGTRTGQLSIGSDAQGNPHVVNLSGTGFNPSGNLAAGKPTTETSHVQALASGNAVDGDANTYWESNNNAFPQSITVDLGASTSVNKVTMKLPPATAWATRTETVQVLGSTDGTTFSEIAAATGYTFNPATGNSASANFTATNRRYIRLTVTGNTGWPAGQFSEVEVYGGGTQPSGPAIGLSSSSLSFSNQTVGTTSGTQTVTVTNTGGSAATLGSTSISGDFARTTTCGSSLAAGASCTISVTFTPTVAGTRSGSISFTSNAPGSPHTITLAGNGIVANTNLALNKSVAESGHADIYNAARAVDGNAGTYWESVNNAWPQTITVDLGAATSVGRVVVKLPSGWGTRTQTLSVLGSTNNTSFSTLKASAGYEFNPGSANTVTITFTATSQRYVRLSFTGNTGWPAGQVSEFEVYAS
ncbi:hypothetical protein F4553_002677 [Allocatelliglobosispora scoriae]|uniref:F5/8 type C domain-containing protein n=1 Tax=Allocatelliglobosispora scoriae TaxID=643052 RepID=A0A841BPJ9_9ACTN|nr:choice-of-anchor D domain-containing protein [Allocatelliglobosispora scoriae]MBB5869298.1 hypothetical protein [Allocatelliglobosispora scoriae]